MKKAVLIFPDTQRMADFITSRNICNVEVNSKEQSLIAPLDDDDIIEACSDYKAHLVYDPKSKTPFKE
jgi:hypothetical protein